MCDSSCPGIGILFCNLRFILEYNFRLSQQYLNFSLGVLKNSFKTHYTEWMKYEGQKWDSKNGNTGEYEGPDYT